jgi:hypothetical protein
MREDAVFKDKYTLAELRIAKGYNQTWVAQA